MLAGDLDGVCILFFMGILVASFDGTLGRAFFGGGGFR
jgi:hypothetical protein